MIRLDAVSKIFGTGVAGLSDINLLVGKGEFVFLVGHTGSGKTTLLRLLVRDMLPTEGTIVVSDFDIVKLPSGKIPELRKKIGVVFQDLKLLMDRTILENIILPMQVGGLSMEESIKRAEELLEHVGLASHKEKFPVQLSGGELQRVAIARALALAPEILLADEPTGNLDPQTAQEIVDLLMKINNEGTTIIMATHNLDIVEKMKKRVIKLEKGKLVRDDGKGSVKEHDKKTETSEGKKEKGDSANKSDSDKDVIPAKAGIHTSEETVSRIKSGMTEGGNSSSHDMNGREDHKKETKKLSDLLAKARQTLHKKESDLPFGFEKEADIKEEKKEEK